MPNFISKASNWKSKMISVKHNSLYEKIVSVPFIKVLDYYGIRFSKKDSFFIQCPFHHETKASFWVKNNYGYCFGCQWVGGAIKFIQAKENKSFKRAVTKLCKISNIKYHQEELNEVLPKLRSWSRGVNKENKSFFYRKLILRIAKDFITFYQSLPHWREIGYFIDWRWEFFDGYVSGVNELDIELIDKVKDWFFESKRMVKNYHKGWEDFGRFKREAREALLGFRFVEY